MSTVAARDVLHRRVGRLAQRQGRAGVGDDTTADGHDDPRRVRHDGDRMFGSRDH